MRSARHGFILRELIKRDFHSRYIGSALGVGWAVLHPFWQILLFSFVFSLVLKIPPPEDQTTSFAIFLFAGLVPWLGMQEGISRSANAITDNAMLVQKLSFPPRLLIFSCVLGGLIQSALSLAILVPILVYRGEFVLSNVGWILVILPFQVALSLGLGLGFAALNVFLRDISQFLTILLNAWFYVTPIVYPLFFVAPGSDATPEQVQRVEAARSVIESNPLTAIVEGYRYALMGGSSFEPWTLWILSGSAVAILGLGWWLFEKLAPGFADAL